LVRQKKENPSFFKKDLSYFYLRNFLKLYIRLEWRDWA